MHLDVLDLRNFYYRMSLKSLSALAKLACAMALALLVIGSSGAVADTVPLDRALVESCYQNTSLDTLSSDCVGMAADKCSKTPPLHQSTLDIWTCHEAEARVWDEIAAVLIAHNRLSWRAQDKANRESGHNIEVEGMATEADFEGLILAEHTYRMAMCNMIYAAHGEGSIKNIYAAQCKMEMASSWAFKMRDVDWNRAGVSIRREP